MASLILFCGELVLVYMVLWWGYSLYRGRSDVADIAWGLGFVAITTGLMLKTGSEVYGKGLLALIMVCIWGFRLALHIAARHRGRPEDGRYIAMKAGYKHPKLQSLVYVFLLQGLLMLLVASPIILFFYVHDFVMHWYGYFGLGIWVLGFLFEAIGDLQLAKFINRPSNKGKIMKYGLWSLSRHPNYFGEITLWWGFYLLCASGPFWYLGLIGPITITLLILGVSGIPMLEKRYIGNKDYDDYKSTTSAFVPWFKSLQNS